MKPTEQEITNAARLNCTFPTSGYINEQREIENAKRLLREGFIKGAQWAISQMQPEWVACSDKMPNNNKHRLIQIEIPTVGLSFYVAGYDPIYKEWLNPFGDKVEEKVIQWTKISQLKTK